MKEREPRPSFHGPDASAERSAQIATIATRADLEQLTKAIPPPEDDPGQYEFLLQQQEQGVSQLFVLREGEEVVGVANLTYDWQSPHAAKVQGAYADTIAVAARHRGRGLVDSLLQTVERAAEGRGAADLYLGVYADNQAAITAHERNGYSEVPDSTHTLPVDVDPEQIPEVYYKKTLT